ncbi:MAG: hypothetical protein JWN73_2678 [Betaproteobacteria bacterium]|nr:hypothetical protein [Betaproteobacteria bacterium]
MGQTNEISGMNFAISKALPAAPLARRVSNSVSSKQDAANDDGDAHALHSRLAAFNAQRLIPTAEDNAWEVGLAGEIKQRIVEERFIQGMQRAVADRLIGLPRDLQAFMAWFEELRLNGPGQNDPLFPWLAERATTEQMNWFLTQEAAGEAGFDDLVALTQVRLPTRPKLEMARNYWDEMGRGHERGMHGPMLSAAVSELRLTPCIRRTCHESLALSNLMVGLAANRRYAYQSIGALGAIEMTAPARVSLVNDGLRRLGAPTAARKYFQLHAGLDIQHSKAWNEEVIGPLVDDDPTLARPIAEGALMRLLAGGRCFARYRGHFGI